MKRKILLYGDLNLNIVDGSSVWLMSIAKLLAKDKDNMVDILIKDKIRRDILVKELKCYNNVTLLNADEYIPKTKQVNSTNITKLILKIDKLRDYSCIIVRGFKIVQTLANDSSIVNKLIPYLTDFCHEEDKISNEEIQVLTNIYNKVKVFFVQTVQMMEYLMSILNIDGKKFKILNPIIFKEEHDIKRKNKSIVYAGKLAKDWNIIELLEIMEELYKKDKDITLHFIGDKFNKDLAEQKEEIIERLKKAPNIIFYGSLPKKETNEIINSCELGYSFRSINVDNDNSLELSSKILEYCYGNVPLLLRKTKMHESVLGKDYPLYVESTQECIEKIQDYFNNRKKYSQLQSNLHKYVDRFKPENIYKNIIEALELFPKKKLRLLITGHDLKFIKDLFPFFEKEYELIVEKYEEYMNIDFDNSKKLLEKADIIWCEWLLLNAQWYSLHSFPHQKIYIRAHRFEIDRKYGANVKWGRVTKLITVSYYYMEQFIEKFSLPRYKVTVINNYINTSIYSLKKNDDFKYNIAMIGILPKRKGFSNAIDLLIKLKEKNDRYKLYIAGKRPEEFANTWNIKEEKQYYLDVYEKIKKHDLESSVVFTGWVDIPKFLENIGYVLSLSDKNFPESFHIAPFEAMASGGVGLALSWKGIEYIYPEYVVNDSINEIADKIQEYNENIDKFKEISETSKKFVVENYDISIIWSTIYHLIENGGY